MELYNIITEWNKRHHYHYQISIVENRDYDHITVHNEYKWLMILDTHRQRISYGINTVTECVETHRIKRDRKNVLRMLMVFDLIDH